MEICNFSEAWIGKCEEFKPCSKHADLKCSSCGEPATRSCDATSQFVCGAPLCEKCEHVLDPNGTTSRAGTHCLKSAQKFKPWYAQSPEEQIEGNRLQKDVDKERSRQIDEIIASGPWWCCTNCACTVLGRAIEKCPSCGQKRPDFDQAAKSTAGKNEELFKKLAEQ